MKTHPASRQLGNQNGLFRGGAALAATATAALAAPVTVVLETPYITDATITTPDEAVYALNVFTREHQAIGPSSGEPPLSFNQAGSIVFGSFGLLDDPEASKPAFAPFVAGARESVDGVEIYSTVFAGSTGEKGELLTRLGTSSLISGETFSATTDVGTTGTPYLLEDPSAYNLWLSGESDQFFIPFNVISGASSTYGWLEFVMDAPSVSLALLAYGYDDEGNSIATPEDFTDYTPPEAFVIPEPSAYSVTAALVAGSVALYRRRRAVA